MSDKTNENTDKKGTCVYEKDIHVSYKGEGVTRTRAGAPPFISFTIPSRERRLKEMQRKFQRKTKV
jgi:hypothetical protein